jgi:porphobilinogen synthase
VNGLSGVEVDTLHSVLKTIEECVANGINKFLFFPVPANKVEKDFDFSFAVSVIKNIREFFGEDVWLAADLCLCSYTSHGHCGILNEDHSKLINHKTVEVLTRYALQLANAGVNCIAPSDMMDGRIASIRSNLDVLGFDQVSIMSYAAKFSSQFYGPFRDACHSSPNTNGLKNRKTYQLSPQNINDAIASALRDEKEGADILMVKPAALYTDVIAKLKQNTLKPIAAYHVSGEYASIEALAEKRLVNREAAHLEVWTTLTRAGADIIISYAAKHAKQWIDKMEY